MSDKDNGQIVLWQGRDIREMSRDELEQAFRQLGELYRSSVETGLKLFDLRRLR